MICMLLEAIYRRAYIYSTHIAPNIMNIGSVFFASYRKLEFGMYPQNMPTEWTHASTRRPWQSVRLDL